MCESVSIYFLSAVAPCTASPPDVASTAAASAAIRSRPDRQEGVTGGGGDHGPGGEGCGQLGGEGAIQAASQDTIRGVPVLTPRWTCTRLQSTDDATAANSSSVTLAAMYFSTCPQLTSKNVFPRTKVSTLVGLHILYLVKYMA